MIALEGIISWQTGEMRVVGKRGKGRRVKGVGERGDGAVVPDIHTRTGSHGSDQDQQTHRHRDKDALLASFEKKVCIVCIQYIHTKCTEFM